MESFGSLVKRHSMQGLIVAWTQLGVMTQLDCNVLTISNVNYCLQTKSPVSFRRKGVFWGTLEWILLPQRETNWACQASLQEWLKLVCGSAFAPSNKDEKPQREREGEKGQGGEMRAKKPVLVMAHKWCHSLLFFRAVAAQLGGNGTARTQTGCGQKWPSLYSGTIFRREVSGNLRDGKTGSEEVGLFVQPVGIMSDVATRGAGGHDEACVGLLGAHLVPADLLESSWENKQGRVFRTIRLLLLSFKHTCTAPCWCYKQLQNRRCLLQWCVTSV